MTVPSQFKGFSRLPEQVQRKMDPQLAKKYNMGGGVLQRPLFMQAGGPAQPMPMAPPPPPAQPPMAPPPPMVPPPMAPQGPDPMVQQTEAQFENMGERLAQDTLANINQAEDIEGAINGLRGNEKPIEARYDELAGFVGKSDAQQTPESVLAMVQPTIMMTEQGAMDSGIGELIQSLAVSEMETPMGEPTAMGQGVGELMTMGAGNTPPVNFNQGGPVEVRRYAQGDPQGVTPIGATQYGEILNPVLESLRGQTSNIFGTPEQRAQELEEAKRFQRGQAALDFAKFGLALASPTDQPMSFAEKLAAAGQPLATSFQERGQAVQDIKSKQKAEERALAMQTLGMGVDATKDVFGRMVDQSMQERGLGTQLSIAQINNASREKIAGMSTASAKEVAEISAQLQKDLLKTRNIHDEKKYESAQAHDKELREIIKTHTMLIDNNKAYGDQDTLKLNNQLMKDRARLEAQLRTDARADELGIIHSNDLEKLEASYKNAKKLQTHSSNLTLHRENVQNSFTALQRALDRESTVDLETAKNALQLEIANMNISQAEKERIQRGALATIDNVIKREGLSIEEAKLAITEQYNADIIDIKTRELEAQGILDDVQSQIIRYINDNDRLEKYKTNSLTETEKNVFENQLLAFVDTKTYVDPVSGMNVISRNAVSGAIKDALKTTNPELYKQITGMEVPEEIADPVTGKITDRTKNPANLFRTNNTGQISLNLNSDAFKDILPTTFSEEVDYAIPIGASRVIPGIKAIFKGGAKELTGENVPDVSTEQYKEGQADLKNLSNKLLSYLGKIGANFDEVGSARQFKFVTELLEKEVEKIRPGGLFFRTDADAAAAFSAFEEQLRSDIQVLAQKVPEYSGIPGGSFSQQQVQKARSVINQLLPLYKDVVLFKDHFNMGGGGLSGSRISTIDKEAVNQSIRNLIKK